MELTKTKLQQGIWEGVITNAGGQTPSLLVTHQGKEVPDVSLDHNAGNDEWVVQIPIPADAVSDGVQTLLINDRDSSDRLGQVTLIAGEALGDDLRAEVDLLRAELDMLKRAFRRHCVETG